MDSLACCAIASSLSLFSRPHSRMGVAEPICLVLWESLFHPLHALIPPTAFPRHTLASCFFLELAMTNVPLVYVLVKLSPSLSLLMIRLKKQYHKTFVTGSIIQLLIPLFPSNSVFSNWTYASWRCVTVSDLPFIPYSVCYTAFMCIDSINIHIHLRGLY